ncbi:unnamed protein product [Adineta ricciae]|uniref:Transposase n=1 Tax=Adineta ricciae TaxID=249248 RepID=A0A816DAC0_ADIRI|nr:unnamed protein product [Adineta ricciae]CAF1635526.1 unnamed protein product [Adineta ricciae]
MDSEQQENWAKKKCGKLYCKLLRGYDPILDGENFFKLTGDNVNCNRSFYSAYPAATPPGIKFRKQKKFEQNVVIWMAISSKDVYNVYVHKSKQGMNQDVYLNECINKRLLPFVEKHTSNGNYLFWPDLASAHYSKSVQACLSEKDVPFVIRKNNSPNVPVQSKQFCLYSNRKYTRTTGRQKT